MKASLQWMNEYVPLDLNRPAQELADELTQAGIPVEEVLSMDPGLKKIYTGKIVEITKHPDADKLQVCQVQCLSEDGEEITKQIVTAATNVAVGQSYQLRIINLVWQMVQKSKKVNYVVLYQKACSAPLLNSVFPLIW